MRCTLDEVQTRFKTEMIQGGRWKTSKPILNGITFFAWIANLVGNVSLLIGIYCNCHMFVTILSQGLSVPLLPGRNYILNQGRMSKWNLNKSQMSWKPWFSSQKPWKASKPSCAPLRRSQFDLINLEIIISMLGVISTNPATRFPLIYTQCNSSYFQLNLKYPQMTSNDAKMTLFRPENDPISTKNWPYFDQKWRHSPRYFFRQTFFVHFCGSLPVYISLLPICLSYLLWMNLLYSAYYIFSL